MEGLRDEQDWNDWGVVGVCLERDPGWAGDPPIPVSPTDGTRQANPAAGRAFPGNRTREFVFLGESGIVYFCAWTHRERIGGISFGEYTNWTLIVAGAFGYVGGEILASSLMRLNDLNHLIVVIIRNDFVSAGDKVRVW